MHRNEYITVTFVVIFTILATVSVYSYTTEANTTGPRINDAEFFEELNLENKNLSKVKSAFEKGDLLKAKQLLAQHLRSRAKPRWFFDWRDKPTPDKRPKNPHVAEADRYTRNELVSVGIWHDFGADIDWNANPTPDGYREWTTQLNRHRFWKKLGRAYWETGDEKYAKAFVFQMTDWVKDNPVPLDSSAVHGGSSWQTLEAGIRMSRSWLHAFYYFLSSPSFKDETIITMLKSFVEHARYLMKFNTKGNWLLHEMTGLYYVGAMFPEFREAQTWRSYAMERLYKELDFQVYPDGSHFELSTSYHQIALRYFVRTLLIAQLNNYPVPTDYLNKLERMYNYNLYAVMPDGRLPGLNDGDYTDVRKSLRQGFRFFPHRRDFLWLATDGTKGISPEKTSYVFPYAGQLVMRSGWGKDSRYLLFDVGPFGFKHQHEDKLNFIIHAYGKNLLIDPGNYRYDRSKWRRYIKSSYAHNVIHVDGKEQHRRGLKRARREKYYVVKKPVMHVWESTKDFDYASASFGLLPEEGFGDKREKIATHTRHILYVKGDVEDGRTSTGSDYWLVVDALKPNDENPHTYEAFFHLDVRDVDVDPMTRHIFSLNDNTANLHIIPIVDEELNIKVIKGQERPFIQGWIPRVRNKGMRPIPTIVFERTSVGVTYFIYIFYPIPQGGMLPALSVDSLSLTPDTIRVRVAFEDGGVDELQVGRFTQVQRCKKRP